MDWRFSCDMWRKGANPDANAARVAARQHGVLSMPQLEAAGLSESQVLHRARSGRLHRIHRGVYAVGHRALSNEARWMAAVLACGDGAVLSHRSAAALGNGRRHDSRLGRPEEAPGHSPASVSLSDLRLDPPQRDPGDHPGSHDRRPPSNVPAHQLRLAIREADVLGLSSAMLLSPSPSAASSSTNSCTSAAATVCLCPTSTPG